MLWLTFEKSVIEFKIQLKTRRAPCEDILLGESQFNVSEMNTSHAIVNLRKEGEDTGISVRLSTATETDESTLRQFLFLNPNDVCNRLTILAVHCDALTAARLTDLYFNVFPADEVRAASHPSGSNPSVSLLCPHARPFPIQSTGMASTEIPFCFLLPDDLPSSAVLDEQTHLSYSILCLWEGQADRDREPSPVHRVSARAFFSVLQPLAAAAYLRPQVGQVHIPYRLALWTRRLWRLLTRRKEAEDARRLRQQLPKRGTGLLRVDCMVRPDLARPS